MNKRGFTLIELLATLGILILMGLIIGVNITSILKSTEESEKEFDKEQIEKAACVFADSHCSGSACIVQVHELVSAGLLGNDYAGSTGSVKVCYRDFEKICEFNCTSNCKCG